MNTVAGNEALVIDAARRHPHLDIFGLNLGFVKTNIRGNLFGSKLLLSIMEGLTGFITLKPEVCSQRMTPLLVSPDIHGKSDAMFNNKVEAILPSAKVAEVSPVRSMMDASDRLVRRVLAA